ncbi:MAG: GntR family transcriptional regulator [Candidatus Acidiferrum sp.]|jgi:GntR family transcriptional regulator
MELTCIDHSGVEPLYYQIQQQLFERIRLGELKAGDPLPSEQEISTRLGVSRMTARLAIKSLCEVGIVYSKQGKGSFVSGLKLEKNFRQVLSFSEEMAQSGRRPESRPLGFDIVPAEGEVALALSLKPQEKVIRLRRLRIADSVPLGIESSYIPEKLCPDLKATFDPRTSLYQTLSARYGIQIAIADEVVEAGLAKGEKARLLRIAKGSPVFIFTRISYVQQGQAVEYVKSTYRADRYKIVNRLVRVKHRFAVQEDAKSS